MTTKAILLSFLLGACTSKTVDDTAIDSMTCSTRNAPQPVDIIARSPARPAFAGCTYKADVFENGTLVALVESTFNELGQAQSTLDYDIADEQWSSSAFTYDEIDLLVRYTFDEDNDGVVDGSAQHVYGHEDPCLPTEKRLDYDGDGTTDHSERYDYDDGRRLVGVNGSDDDAYSGTYLYDNATEFPSGLKLRLADSTESEWTYTYTEDGQSAKSVGVFASGSEIVYRYKYDSDGNLIKKTYIAEAMNVNEVNTWQYDDARFIRQDWSDADGEGWADFLWDCP